METDQLKLFAEVMRVGSFTSVARERRIAPSSVSRAIASLEAELGARLFQRSTRKLSPTEQAMDFFTRVEPLIDEFERARTLITESNQAPSGHVRISVASVYARHRVVPLLKQIRRDYPGISIELLFHDHFVDLIDERIDLAIRLGKLDDSGLVARQLHPMLFHVCASPDYLRANGTPEHPGDIEKHECLLFPRGDYSLSWKFRSTDGRDEEVKISGACTITNSESIRDCCVEGMGLALLPDWLIRNDLQQGRLISLLGQYQVTATDFDSTAWLVYPSRQYLPQKTRVLGDFLVQQLGD